MVKIMLTKLTAPSLMGRAGGGVLLFLFLLSFAACDDYDSFTTDRSHTLRFSADTVTFDTLLTTVASSTQTLTVFNLGDKGLRIATVHLEGGAASPFRVNIDGQDMSRSEANRVTDFEVRRRDSIMVRIELTLPRAADDAPFAVDDGLVFTLESGVQQRVALTAVGQNADFIQALVVRKDTTLTARRPIVIRDSLVVAHKATLTLEAGTRLMFHDGAGLTVRGRLVARGTREAPVVLRTDRTDRMFDYLPYDRLPSRWEGVRLAATSLDNELDYVDLHGAKWGIACDSTGIDAGVKLTLTNSRLHFLGGDGLASDNCRLVVANSEISNTLGHCVRLLGGDARFTHCTLAQFYPLSALRGDAVNISFYNDSLGYQPLVRADFTNCVVTGYAEDVIIIPSLNADDWPDEVRQLNPEVHYVFRSCFLATEVPEGEEYQACFLSCTYDAKEGDFTHEKNFQHFDSHDFLYDFTPVEGSGIRGIADPTATQPWPQDRSGRSRLADGAPDAGCYEFQATQ